VLDNIWKNIMQIQKPGEEEESEEGDETAEEETDFYDAAEAIETPDYNKILLQDHQEKKAAAEKQRRIDNGDEEGQREENTAEFAESSEGDFSSYENKNRNKFGNYDNSDCD
jgi:hypothetical protein